MNPAICEAIKDRRLLTLTYHWGFRTVEPHAYGLNTNGHELVRVYQTSGSSESGQPHGWKLLRVDEIRHLDTLDQHFAGPRQGYNRGDPALNRSIYCEL